MDLLGTYTQRKEMEAAAGMTSREIPIPWDAGWPGPKPFARLAQHLAWLSHTSHGASMAFAWLAQHLHALRRSHGAVGTTCPAVSGHQEPSPSWGRRPEGQAEEGVINCFSSY